MFGSTTEAAAASRSSSAWRCGHAAPREGSQPPPRRRGVRPARGRDGAGPRLRSCSRGRRTGTARRRSGALARRAAWVASAWAVSASKTNRPFSSLVARSPAAGRSAVSRRTTRKEADSSAPCRRKCAASSFSEAFAAAAARRSAQKIDCLSCASRAPRPWCERRDSNPQGFPHGILSPARLPVPPLSRGREMVGVPASDSTGFRPKGAEWPESGEKWHRDLSRRRDPPGSGVIEVHLEDLAQIFNSIDPSPFFEKDLDREAEAFIVSAAKESPSDRPLGSADPSRSAPR